MYRLALAAALVATPAAAAESVWPSLKAETLDLAYNAVFEREGVSQREIQLARMNCVPKGDDEAATCRYRTVDAAVVTASPELGAPLSSATFMIPSDSITPRASLAMVILFHVFEPVMPRAEFIEASNVLAKGLADPDWVEHATETTQWKARKLTASGLSVLIAEPRASE